MPKDGEFDIDELIPILNRLMEFDEEATMHLVQAMGSELAWVTERLARTSAENRAFRRCIGQIANYERLLAVQVDRIWEDSDRDELPGLDAEWLGRMGVLVEMLGGFSRRTSESPP